MSLPQSLKVYSLKLQLLVEKTCDENGWARLAEFGSYLTKLQPDFEPRAFGFKKISELIKAKPDLFELEEKPVLSSGGKALVLYVRAKKS